MIVRLYNPVVLKVLALQPDHCVYRRSVYRLNGVVFLVSFLSMLLFFPVYSVVLFLTLRPGVVLFELMALYKSFRFDPTPSRSLTLFSESPIAFVGYCRDGSCSFVYM